jgi:hypothetical protein
MCDPSRDPNCRCKRRGQVNPCLDCNIRTAIIKARVQDPNRPVEDIIRAEFGDWAVGHWRRVNGEEVKG